MFFLREIFYYLAEFVKKKMKCAGENYKYWSPNVRNPLFFAIGMQNFIGPMKLNILRQPILISVNFGNISDIFIV